jgi:hypothetical protein
MNFTADETNALIVTLVNNLRNDLFEPTDYAIIELVDMMILNEEQGIPELSAEDVIDREETLDFALNTALHMIYRTVADLRPGHFAGDAWRYDIMQLDG